MRSFGSSSCRHVLSVAALIAALSLAMPGSAVAATPRTALAAPPAGFGESAGFCASAVPGGYTLGASFDNVYACGPANNSGTGYDVPASGPYLGFFEDAPWTYQCTELANRFVFDAWGLAPITGGGLDGANYAS